MKRTSIAIDDSVWRQAKQAAAAQGVKLQDLVGDAMAEYLRTQAKMASASDSLYQQMMASIKPAMEQAEQIQQSFKPLLEQARRFEESVRPFLERAEQDRKALEAAINATNLHRPLRGPSGPKKGGKKGGDRR